MAEIAQGTAASPSSAPAPKAESDFSPRKLKIAGGMLIGQSFGTSILPYSAMMLMLMPLTQQFGWTAEQFSWGVTCLFMAGAFSLWPLGRLIDKWGARPVLIIGTILVGLVTLAMAFQTNNLVQFYVLYALLGVTGSTANAYTKITAALFTQHRGKAMAILTAETTLARAGIPLFVNWLLLTYGWQTMYIVFACMILACVPVLFFTIEEPGQRGIAFRRAAAAPPQPKVDFPGMTIWEALKDWVFWLTALSALLGLFIFNGMFPHVVPALVGKGFSQTTVIQIQSVAITVAFVGALIGGWAADRFQTAKVAVPICLAAALGSYLTLIASPEVGGVWLLGAALIVGAVAFMALFPMGQYFATRFFGLRSLAEIIGVGFMFTNVLAGFGAPLFGAIFDATHSYDFMFITAGVMHLVTALIYFVLPKYRYAKNIGQMPLEPVPTTPTAAVEESEAAAETLSHRPTS
jgi:MFS family permease